MSYKFILIIFLLFASLGLAEFFVTSSDEGSINTTTTYIPITNQTTIMWKGEEWNIRSDSNFNSSTNNVWIDQDGNLHTTVKNVGGRWSGTELDSTTKYQFGTFKWTVSSPLLSIDKNAASSMYLYIDDYHRINIEATGWGDSSSNKLWYEVQPTSISDNSYNAITSTSSYTKATNITCSFDWEPNYIHFNSKLSNGTTIADWNYTNISGIPLQAGNVIMSTWLFNEPPIDGKDIEVVYKDFSYTPSPASMSQVQSGVYNNCNFTMPVIFWSESARQIGGKNGIVDLVVGQAQANGLCFVSFPYNNGVPKEYIYSWVSKDQAEPYLKQLEKDGRKVILSIQPNQANVSDAIDLVLSHYGNHKNILGINVDCEWKNTGKVQHVSNAERDAWIAKIYSYNPDYKLFLTNTFGYTYFPDDNNNIVIMFDDQGMSQEEILGNYQQLAKHFTNIGLYTGFPDNTPPTAEYADIIGSAPNTKYILHNTWKINDQIESSEMSNMPGLWGRIYDSSTGNPLGGAVINVYNNTWSISYETSESGEYWISSINPGVYNVRVMASGYNTSSTITLNLTGGSVHEDIYMESS